MHRGIRVLVFLVPAAGVVWIAWPGSASDSAVAVNRIQVPLILVLLAGLPLVVRRYCGPVRDSWWPLSVRVGGYAVVLALIAGKAVIARDGSKLGAYFHQNWDLETVLVLVIASYVAGILILTSQRVRLTRSSLPIGIGVGAVSLRESAAVSIRRKSGTFSDTRARATATAAAQISSSGAPSSREAARGLREAAPGLLALVASRRLIAISRRACLVGQRLTRPDGGLSVVPPQRLILIGSGLRWRDGAIQPGRS